jgi:HK97 family phage major capsid protein
MKWVEITKEGTGHNVGALLEVQDAVATAYEHAGFAKGAGDGPNKALANIGLDAMQGAMKSWSEEITKVFDGAVKQLQTAINVKTIEAGPSEADKKKNLGNFIMCVVKAQDINDDEGRSYAQNRLRKEYGSTNRIPDASEGVKRGMEESTGTLGGFWTTPVVFEKAILMEAAQDAAILPGVTNVPLGARAVEWPALNQYSVPTKGNSAMYGGVTVSRLGENTQRNRTQPVPAKVKLEANDLTAFTQFSRDLAQDDATGTLESMLVKLIGGAIGFRRDYEHFWGTGQGQPLGFMNAPALITTTRTTSGKVTWPDVATMLGRLTPAARKRAVWVSHPFHLTTLLELTDSAGHYIYIPNFPQNNRGQVQTYTSDILANLPVIYSEFCAYPGTTGDFGLVDRSAMLSGIRGGLEFGLSEHFLFDTDQIALRAKIRDDAQPWVKAPFTLADGTGTSTVSPFGALSTY